MGGGHETGRAGRREENLRRQRELYGTPLGDRVRRITTSLGITQRRLAATLGMSPAMLSQLASGRRVKIGDPVVLARFLLLDGRCAAGAVPRERVPALLEQARRAGPPWVAPAAGRRRDGSAGAAAHAGPRGPAAGRALARGRADPATAAAEALRAVAEPARLVAAAVALGPAFPELAALLRRAAGANR